MAKIIDMQSMRQINLFVKISHVPTKHFFTYNNTLIFGVPKSKVSQAIGKDASNVRRLNQILRRKIKVIAMPAKTDYKGIEKFISDLISPIELSKIEIIDGKVEIGGNRLNKASLIGRNRVREKELLTILKNAFDIAQVRIV
jgi:transcription antitermination factor NusA-like protein